MPVEAQKFDRKIWSCTKRELEAEMEKESDLKTEKDVRYFLELKFHLVKDKTKDSHVSQVLTLAGVFKSPLQDYDYKIEVAKSGGYVLKDKEGEPVCSFGSTGSRTAKDIVRRTGAPLEIVERELAIVADSHRPTKKSEKRTRLPSSMTDILKLPEVEEMDGGCFFNIKRVFEGKTMNFTFYFDSEKGSSRKLEKPLFVPPDTQPSSERFLDISPSPTVELVYDSLCKKYEKYLFFIDDDVYMILALAAISTYFREIFDSYPYLDFFAPELNCGKTTAMKCVVWSCFYGLTMVDPTGPVIFRAIDSCKSVVGIDELDNLLTDPDSAGRFLGLLNSAYQRGLTAYRIDTEQQMLPIPYDSFGLKSFTHIKAIPPSISDRSIIINMVRSVMSLPLLSTADVFREERDSLYNIRLRISNEVRTIYDGIMKNTELGLINRDIQKFAPLLTIAKYMSDDCYDRAHRWALLYSKRHAAQRIDEISKTLIEALVEVGASGDVELKVITTRFNDLCFERELIGMKEDGTPRKFGSKKVTRLLEGVAVLKSEYRPQNRVHVFVPPKMVRYWADIYGLSIVYTPPVTNFDNLGNQEQERRPQVPQNGLEQAPQVNQIGEQVNQDAQLSLTEKTPTGVTEGLRGQSVKQVTEVSLPGVYTPTWLDSFVSPAKVKTEVPQILVHLLRLWERHKTTLEKMIQTTDTKELDILLAGVEAGYVVNRMPNNWWQLTPAALEDIRGYGL